MAPTQSFHHITHKSTRFHICSIHVLASQAQLKHFAVTAYMQQVLATTHPSLTDTLDQSLNGTQIRTNPKVDFLHTNTRVDRAKSHIRCTNQVHASSDAPSASYMSARYTWTRKYLKI